jgi:hypothetical protein
MAADLRTVDALARLHLRAQRCGFELRVRCAPPALVELVDFVGLRDVLRIEPRREPEEREERLGVEEEGELDDLPA